MKRVLVVVSTLLLALAIVSCGNLAVDKKGDGGSLVINLGGSEARSTQATIKDGDGNSIGNVTLRTSDDVTDWELFLYTSTGTDVSYTVKEPASSVIQFDDLPEGEFAVGIVAYDGDTPFGFAQSNYNAETGTIDTVTIKAGTVATTEVDFVYMKSISCTGSDKSFMNVHYSTIRPSANIPGSIYVPGFKDHSPVGKEFDYWTVDGDTSGTHYYPNAEFDLNGKTLPIVFVPVWKDATNPPGGDPVPTGWTSVNKNPTSLDITLVTVPSGTVTSPVGSSGGPFKSIDSGDEKTHVTVNSFLLADTELTYEKWYEVYSWATSEERGEYRYTFANPGREGDAGSDGAVPTNNGQPVARVSWRDAIVWCNAASEKEGLKPVYWLAGEEEFIDNSKVLRIAEGDEVENSPLPPASKADAAVICGQANGYRLPEEKEWEFAARGGAPTSEGWNYIYAETNNANDGQNYAVYSINGGTSYSTSQPVGSKVACSLGLYDMCGNMSEWCWDRNEYYQRVYRGGGFNATQSSNEVSSRGFVEPYLRQDFGPNLKSFRVARNAN